MLLIKVCLAVFYLTKILLYQEKESHYGPFPSTEKSTYREATGHVQPVTLFDWVRRFTLNPYSIHDDTWIIDERKMERWSCPTCLSFWITLPFTAYMLVTGKTKGLFNLFVTHFAITAVSAILNIVVDYVQVRSEEKENYGNIESYPGDML
jgi:hypothetical protein